MKQHDGNGATYACYLVSAILLIGNMHIMHSVQPAANADFKCATTYESQKITIPAASIKMEQAWDAMQTGINKQNVPSTTEPTKMEQPIRKYYNVPLSHDVQDIVFSECEANDVPADLVVALIGVESNYNSKCISKTHDYGLMQINICHKDSLKQGMQITDLLDEKQNIKAGVHMLSWIVNKYRNLNQALMVYNCGESGARKLWKSGIYSTAYSRKIRTEIKNIVRCEQ